MSTHHGSGVQPAARAERLLESTWPGRGARPRRVTAVAPGRVNLIGEHTDYNGGFVLPMAIDLACAAAVRITEESKPSRVMIESGRHQAQFDVLADLAPGMSLPDGENLAPGDWRSYAVGVIAMVAERAHAAGHRVKNFDLAIAGDIPLGAGLSSSAAFEVSIATAVAAAWGVELDARARACLCRDAEHRFAGVPCGIMDQFASAMGRRGHALLLDCRSLEFRHVHMPDESRAAVVVFNSNVSHSLASGEYADRRSACSQAASVLGVHQLRDATPQLVAAHAGLALNPAHLRAARHVVTENVRTIAAADALEAGDLAELGRLMNASHDSLRDDYRVSCAELDTLVDAGRATPGVLGARMTGGGFGGCVIMLVDSPAVPTAIAHVRGRYRSRHGIDTAAFAVRAADGAAIVRSEG